ncbi:sensor histidine kinase [Marinobacter fonticola]|uniref:sensor histidine kinase n=1 Tax=Marinobacter fonticola TaxID=2603215 RepID=UPI001930E535|nr:ATP-binding protein [Marinobacter fonticola]
MEISENNRPTSLEEALAQANRQLLQSEKLAAIGQIAAGVAHEINNPVGYVQSNIQTLGNYLQDLFRITDAVASAGSVDELKSIRDNIDYDYVRGDLDDLLKESLEGLDRIKKIIASLKDFSHAEEEAFKPADLHRGIETTLNVVNNELKYKAEVHTDFGDIPSIECIVSQVNQVAMNLLVNAAHAIEQFGRIDIRTGQSGDEVWFEVEDNGAGIDPSNLTHLFEPFYTTKPVGKGTGLGLALSKSIVDKHSGRIEVDSVIGRGTRFRVWLPIQQAGVAPTA